MCTVSYRLSADEVQRKLEMRESLMKRSAIFHVVLGAQNLGSNHVGLSTGHIRILRENVRKYVYNFRISEFLTPLTLIYKYSNGNIFCKRVIFY